jgi:hypothetical protein
VDARGHVVYCDRATKHGYGLDLSDVAAHLFWGEGFSEERS